jgi:hypothetical protein
VYIYVYICIYILSHFFCDPFKVNIIIIIELPSLPDNKEGQDYSGLQCFKPSGVNVPKSSCPEYGGHVFALMTELGINISMHFYKCMYICVHLCI